MIPFKHCKLTPKRALKWMREEYEGYHDLTMDAQRYATEQKDKDAFHNLAHGVARMVEACQAAIEAGKAVYLESDLQEKLKSGPYEFSTIKDYVRVLRFQQIVGGEVIITYEMHDALKALFDVTQRYVEAASEVELKKTRAESRAYFKRKGDPQRHLDALHEQAEKIEAERDAALAPLAAAREEFAKPWERRLACLEYEKALIYHEQYDAKHPGKPPEGYAPSTGPAEAS